MSNSTDSVQIQPQNPLDPTYKPAVRRKITRSDVEAMAELCANRLTEKEACAVLKIKHHSWENWECKPANKAKFEEELSRIKGEQIRTHLARINEASKAVNAKTGIPEWRAAESFLKLSEPGRFAIAPSQVSVNVLVNGAPNDLVEAARQSFLRSSCGVQPTVSVPLPTPQTPQVAQVIDVPTEPQGDNVAQ